MLFFLAASNRMVFYNIEEKSIPPEHWGEVGVWLLGTVDNYRRKDAESLFFQFLDRALPHRVSTAVNSVSKNRYGAWRNYAECLTVYRNWCSVNTVGYWAPRGDFYNNPDICFSREEDAVLFKLHYG